jgi:hypothetical protein
MLTYEKCCVCNQPTGNSVICEDCHQKAEVNAVAQDEWNEQFDEEETDGF